MKSNAIKVGSRTYTIVSTDDERFDVVLSKKYSGDDFDDIKAFIDYDDQLILIREKLSPEHKRELAIHELLHACLEDVGIFQQDEISEKLISALAPRLNQLFSENLHVVLDEIT